MKRGDEPGSMGWEEETRKVGGGGADKGYLGRGIDGTRNRSEKKSKTR